MSSVLILSAAGISTLIASFLLWREVIKGHEMGSQAVGVISATALSLLILTYAGFTLGIISHRGIEGTLLSSVIATTWFVQGIYLLGLLKHGLRGLGLFLLPITALALLISAFLPHEEVIYWIPTSSLLDTGHLLISLIAYALMTIAALHAVMYLLVDRMLKRKKISLLMQSMPSLFDMETYMCAQLLWAVVLLGISILSGLLWQWVDFHHFALLSHKVLLAFFAFIILLTVVLKRKRAGWYGRRTSQMILGAYALLLLAYFGVKIIHSFTG
ncbi:MAG: cytochrome c biogenesis protein CcsA [Zetaproteobacteria bacterium]|nr:cytochrome c biogenesis protein CcsA [Zetaproteobacteria bacterium]